MTIKEQHVNESQIDEVAGLIENEKNMINLDRDDVKSVLVGKEGILYQANQDEGVENSTFMKEFFGALKEKKVVQDCTSMLISIAMSPEDPLMMEDIEIIHDFLESINNESLEVKWGIKNNEEGGRMTILTICTKATT
ncbi:hypothetical protein [uncultured Prevotella sp.]|uniref:hypothetical protein n=1 Tax=uncultured Prevotella sp. TaxID=159272 RepID=UPI0026741E8A|nr:hypothetical protein [uncultured Prevotella sp.]